MVKEPVLWRPVSLRFISEAYQHIIYPWYASLSPSQLLNPDSVYKPSTYRQLLRNVCVSKAKPYLPCRCVDACVQRRAKSHVDSHLNPPG